MSELMSTEKGNCKTGNLILASNSYLSILHIIFLQGINDDRLFCHLQNGCRYYGNAVEKILMHKAL